jgi:hypothetical protein
MKVSMELKHWITFPFFDLFSFPVICFICTYFSTAAVLYKESAVLDFIKRIFIDNLSLRIFGIQQVNISAS